MPNMNRRKFLKMLASSAGGITATSILSACGASPENLPPTATNSALPPKLMIPSAIGEAATAAPTSEATLEATSAAGNAYLAVARGGDDPEALVRAAVGAIGGIERFVKAGAKVVIKPNICVDGRSYEFAATTNPWVVGGLVKMCKEAGAGRILVLDYPFGGTSEGAYVRSGIQAQVEAAGGEMEPISPMKFIPTDISNSLMLSQASIYSEVLDADILINAPIAKHHSLATLTLGMKNLMGVVEDRPSIHRSMAVKLTDLTGFLKPALTVLDAVRILLDNGPTGGDLNDVKKIDTVIASADIVAVDAYGATLFGKDGYSEIPYIQVAADAGLGIADLTKIQIKEIPVGG